MLPMLITLAKGAVTVAPAVEAMLRQRRAGQAAGMAAGLEVLREAASQAWQAYQFQVQQRNIINAAAIIALSVLGLAYAIALVGDMPVLAVAGALAGMALTVFQNRIDAANRSRLRALEATFREIDERLIALGDPSRAGLLPRAGRLSTDVLLILFQATAFWGFAIAFIYAVVEAA